MFASNQKTPQVQIIVILLPPGAFFIATKLGGNIYVANTGHLRESAILFYIIFSLLQTRRKYLCDKHGRGERIVFWRPNTNTNIIRSSENDRIRIRIIFGPPKMTEYEYEYYSVFQKWPNTNTNNIRSSENDRIRIRIICYSNIIRIIFGYRIIRSPLWETIEKPLAPMVELVPFHQWQWWS